MCQKHFAFIELSTIFRDIICVITNTRLIEIFTINKRIMVSNFVVVKENNA